MCSDSVATRGRAQGQAVIEYLGKRPAVKNQSLIGSVTAASRFEDTKRNLMKKLTDALKQSLSETGDVTEQQAYVIKALRQTVWVSTTLQTGTLSSAIALAAQLVDPMIGVVALSSLALTGGVWWMSSIRRIQQNFRNEWNQRALKLDTALQSICDKELERVNRRILDGVAPYTRFVESEQERIDNLQEQCEGVCVAAQNLRNRINKL